MALFLIILVSSLFSVGIIILFRLNKVRLQLYADINHQKIGSKKPEPLSAQNADEKLAEHLQSHLSPTPQAVSVNLNQDLATKNDEGDIYTRLRQSMVTVFEAQKEVILNTVQDIVDEVLSERIKTGTAIPTSQKEQSKKTEAEKPEVKETEAGHATTSGYLARQQLLFTEESDRNEALSTNQEEDELIVMQLVISGSDNEAGELKINQQTQPIMMSNVEEPAPQDETEELRRRAMERIAKLRNLSFNINAADPNNEFETVPAYLRRNMELHNSIANVESFYSNYTVKSDDNNQAEIGTINTFLEGKKPD